MGIQNGVSNPQAKFDPNKFAPAKNTITLTKLLLLDPETLNQLLKDNLSPPVYSSADNGFGQDNAMLDYIRSLDANHQWRIHSTRQGDIGEQEAGEGEGAEITVLRQHSEGMPIWMDCLARQRVFRVIFTDWENGNFPHLGEGGVA